jgi:hypothetical protein
MHAPAVANYTDHVVAAVEIRPPVHLPSFASTFDVMPPGLLDPRMRLYLFGFLYSWATDEAF